MKVRRKRIDYPTIGSQRVGVVFRFTDGVYGIFSNEVCMKLPFDIPPHNIEGTGDWCKVASLLSGKVFEVARHFRIQELDVELHVLGDTL